MSFFDRKHSDAKGYEAIPTSETQPLVVVGVDERIRRKRCRRRFCHFLFAAIALIFVGQGVFAYMYTRSHVECVSYEGPKTVVKIPILYPRSAVLLDASVSSNDVTVTRVEKDSNEITLTLEEAAETPEESAEIRLCVLKGGKLTGLGIFAGKKHDGLALPSIKSLKIEIPTSAPSTSVDLLPPRRRCHGAVNFLKWAGVWNSKVAGAAKLEAAGTSD